MPPGAGRSAGHGRSARRRPAALAASGSPLLADGDVAVVAQGYMLRVLAARWLGLEPAGGRLFRLDTGTLSTLGRQHGELA